ncbi:MAG: 3-oxoacyl-ACP synthase III family protein [Bacteroidetes bacterium]|nr:3-oxoacyl-ACP synthase III family protein [Bacteroidota bacterium]
MSSLWSVISGTGSFIPDQVIPNSHFLDYTFYNPDGTPIASPADEIIRKFEKITTITERRWADRDHMASDLGTFAAERALTSSDTDKEDLDYIIVAHNFGDIRYGSSRIDMLPSLAARVKHKLGIRNPKTVAYDLPFGCPGWLQGVIQGNYYIKSGEAKRVLVIGTETLSRIVDPHDRDTMIYSDGAGAVILEARESETPVGILSTAMRSDTVTEAFYLWLGDSYKPGYCPGDLFLKMDGRKLYEYAVTTVPGVISDCLSKAGLKLSEFKKALMHQANGKMNEAILKRVFSQNGDETIPDGFMPMAISWMGNNSVATIPVVLDRIMKGLFPDQDIASGDHVVFASVGAGMNVNSVAYRMP